MREIKFKAKIRGSEGIFDVTTIDFGSSISISTGQGEVWTKWRYVEELLQYIGREDIYRQELYHKDKVKWEAKDADRYNYSGTGTIEWNDEEVGFVIETDSDEWPVIAMRFITKMEKL